MRPDLPLEILDSPEAVAQRAAFLIARELRRNCEQQGRSTLAVSGGQTPRRMLELLSKEDLPWDHIDVFQVDERFAPEGNPDRNASEIQKAFGNVYARHSGQFHWMPVTDANPAHSAKRYAQTLAALTGPERTIDVVHLGLGADGHTASLFPGEPLPETDDDVTLTAEHSGWRRMTLTLPSINRARFILWVVTGAGKRQALEALRNGEPGVPSSAVKRSGALIVADRDAAGSASPEAASR